MKVILVGQTRSSWIKENPKKNTDLSRFLASKEEFQCVKKALLSKNMDVDFREINKNNFFEIYKEISKIKCALWNLTDGVGTFLGSNLPSVFTLMNKPYIGSSTYVQALCQKKHHVKSILAKEGIPTPDFMVARKADENYKYKILEELKFPVFVKPAMFDNGVGCAIANPFCQNLEDVKKCIEKLYNIGINHVLCENFLPNTEYTAVCIHLEKWHKVIFKQEYRNNYLCARAKDENPEYFFGMRQVKQDEIEKLAMKIISILNIKDYCRIDFRKSENGEVNFLEINSSPFITGNSFTNAAKVISGDNYTQVYKDLVEYSVFRQKEARNHKNIDTD